MNRRELLGVAAAVPLAVLPLGTASSTTTTTRKLLERIERRFKCVEGPARSYFEGVTPSGEFGRAIYQSFVNGVATVDSQAVEGLQSEAQALQALWKTFEAYAIGKKGRLYWRKRPVLYVVTPKEEMDRLGLIQVSPGMWQTLEVVEDGLNCPAKTPAEWGCPATKHYARMRLNITEIMPFITEEYDGPFRVDRPSGEVWQRKGRVSL